VLRGVLCRCPKKGGRTVFVLVLVLGLVASLVGLLPVPLVRADGGVLATRQAIIILRVLPYDANLNARARQSINVAVLHRRGHAESERMAETMAKAFGALASRPVAGLPVQVSRIPFTSIDALKKYFDSAGIDLVYVCQGLESELPAIADVTRQMRVLSVGSSQEQVQKGLSLGVFEIDEKCTILLNLPASRLEGVAFGPDLLRLAKVIR
jgi:hypothetical protein